MPQQEPLAECLQAVQELEEFCHCFIKHLVKVRPKTGEDVTRYAEELGLELPRLMGGAPIIWDGPEKGETDSAAETMKTLVLTRPGNAEAVGLTLGCIRWGRIKICLECGFFYCRIVIKGRF